MYKEIGKQILAKKYLSQNVNKKGGKFILYPFKGW